MSANLSQQREASTFIPSTSIHATTIATIARPMGKDVTSKSIEVTKGKEIMDASCHTPKFAR